ncbi:DUF2255 family protein [Chryseobacterium sp. MYb264]|uniref:DUF2255 family protein n=1 Tax=Chryseobacterium sp. MYb264 TaxID=2745153 RepID=UPI002E1010B7|nr:DUF2255 family protein [Chryseobacterium sp. MYb264]
MTEKLIPQELLDYIKENTLIGIKGGKSDRAFLDIWMVSVNQRVFARSWGMSERSWFTTFRELGVGQIKFGDQIIDVEGKIIVDSETNALINKAYKTKYTQKENEYYVEAITEPKYNDYTMEFIMRDSSNS